MPAVELRKGTFLDGLQHCRRCDTEWEQDFKFGKPAPKCPKCGAKIFFRPPVHYKGKGFYSTDWMKKRDVNIK